MVGVHLEAGGWEKGQPKNAGEKKIAGMGTSSRSFRGARLFRKRQVTAGKNVKKKTTIQEHPLTINNNGGREGGRAFRKGGTRTRKSIISTMDLVCEGKGAGKKKG